jgi:chitodextrinase
MARRIATGMLAAAAIAAIALSACDRAPKRSATSEEPRVAPEHVDPRAGALAPDAIGNDEVEAMRQAAALAGLTEGSSAEGSAPPVAVAVPPADPAAARAGPLRDGRAPSSPRALVVAALSPSRVALEWAAATDDTGVTGYQVFRDGISVAVVPGAGFADDALRPQTRHCYSVVAMDAAGNRSAPTRAACAETPDWQAPSAPGRVRVAATGERQVAVSWDAATDDARVAVYEVLRGTAVVSRQSGTSASESGLAPAQTYCYAVRAIDGAGNVSPAAGPACATTSDLTPPTSPDAVVAEVQGEHAVRVRWEPGADDVGVAGYELVRNGKVVATSADVTAVEARLAPTVEYCYTVRARDAAGNRSPEAGPACATPPDLTPPSPPPALAVSAASDTRLELRWGASTDEVGVATYEVFRDRTAITTTDGRAVSDPGLRPGREYCYHVRARDAAGNVSPTSARSCTTTPDVTPPTAPSRLLAGANSPTNVALAWGPASDDVAVTAYEIRRGEAVVARNDARATTWLDTSLPPETEACYAIVALDAAGNRSPSEGPACAKTAPAGVPAGPTLLEARPASATSVVLSWAPSPDPDVVYTVYWDEGGRIGSTVRTTYTAVVRRGERRCYRVVAVSPSGKESPRSFEACAATRPASVETAAR